MRTQLSRGLFVLILGLETLFHVTGVRAGNDDGILLGNDAALMAGAVTATVADGSALWYNPAGLADARLDTVDVSASAFVLRNYQMPRLLSAADGSFGNASVNEIVSVPSALTFVRKLGTRVTAGFGLFVPQYNDFTLRTSLVTHDQITTRWQVALREQEVQYHGGPGIGWAPNEFVSVGFGLYGAYYSQSGSSQVSGGVQDVTGMKTYGFSVQSALEEHSLIGAEAQAGVIVRPVQALSIGLSVRTPALSFHESSRITSVTASSDISTPAMPTAEFTPTDVKKSQGKVGLFEPPRVRLGVAYKFARASVALDGDVQQALRNKSLDVDRSFVWNVRLGGRIPITDLVAVGAGVFTDRGADPKLSSGAGPVHFYGGTMGVQYSNVRKLDPSEQVQKLTFSTTIALRYAHGHGRLEGDYIDTKHDYVVTTPAVDIDVNETSLHIGSALFF